MLWYVKTPTDQLVYHDAELSAVDTVKASTRAARVQAVQDWIASHPNIKWSQLSGVLLIAWNVVKAALQAAGKAEVLTHVVQRGLMPDGRTPKQIALATATYIASWDGQAPAVTTLFGTFPGSISFMGWPQTDVMPDPPDPPTQAQIDAANAAAAAKAAAQAQWRTDAQAQMTLGIPTYQAWLVSNPYPT